MKKHKNSNEECPCKENEENVRNFRKRSRRKSYDSIPTKCVKLNSSKSSVVDLEKDIPNIVSFEKEVHVQSGSEKEAENIIESQIKSNLKKRRPENSTSISLISILEKNKSKDIYEQYRHMFADTFGKVWLEVFKSDSVDISNISGVLEMCPHGSKTFEVANLISSIFSTHLGIKEIFQHTDKQILTKDHF